MDQEEYSAEEISFLRERLKSARESGISERTPSEILAEIKKQLREEGKL